MKRKRIHYLMLSLLFISTAYGQTPIADDIKYAENKSKGEAFLLANATSEGVVSLPSGLQYRIHRKGNGAIPKSTDKVKVDYVGMFIDGNKFDSSIDRGQPAIFPVNRVIAGWVEALQLMPVGSKWELFIPQQLAYGAQNAGRIPPYSMLIFEVELISIEK